MIADRMEVLVQSRGMDWGVTLTSLVAWPLNPVGSC